MERTDRSAVCRIGRLRASSRTIQTRSLVRDPPEWRISRRKCSNKFRTSVSVPGQSRTRGCLPLATSCCCCCCRYCCCCRSVVCLLQTKQTNYHDCLRLPTKSTENTSSLLQKAVARKFGKTTRRTRWSKGPLFYSIDLLFRSAVRCLACLALRASFVRVYNGLRRVRGCGGGGGGGSGGIVGGAGAANAEFGVRAPTSASSSAVSSAASSPASSPATSLSPSVKGNRV